ncbi:MAG: adenine-specific DNA-methyltransferase [Chloroflexota bacterium]|nr:adenine-specific DNA-methyltransferase [Chloroflexota bacterium]MDE2951953.1 adenine-specific DNA-methyltransferase [Chloroflexota bacterium]
MKIHKFQRGDVEVFWGDALEVMSEYIPDLSIDLIFADPPYNIGKNFSKFIDKWESERAYSEWCHEWLDLCIQKLKPNGTIYVMSSTQGIPYIDLYLRERLHILSRIVWHYDSSGVQARNYFGSLYEPILHCVKDKKNYTFNSEDILIEAKTGAKRKLIDYRKTTPQLYSSHKVPGNVWYFPRVRYRMPEYENHPSQKPESLMERIIKASSNASDVVLDPFSGTFTTCAVANRLGRQAIGIELQEEYTKIGLRRLRIQTEFRGETLRAPQKTYKQKITSSQLSLFEDK